jgi:hypothetical protein
MHDDDVGRLEVIILDSAAEEELSVAAEAVTIGVIVDGVREEYRLEPTNASQGLASRFAVVSQPLVVALQVGEGVEATLEIEIEGTKYTGIMEHAEHHH